jgi:hypothetical protein
MTAVEWLINEFELYYNGESELVYCEIIDQAKEMEKQQIIDAYIQGSISLTSKIEAEQYYNEKFKQ